MVNKNKDLVFLIFLASTGIMTANDSHSMSRRRDPKPEPKPTSPAPTPTPAPSPTPSASPSPTPSPTPLPPMPTPSALPPPMTSDPLLDYERYAKAADDRYPSYRALNKVRADMGHSVDQCQQELKNADKFSHVIGYFVEESLEESTPIMPWINSHFGVPKRSETQPASLYSHRMCTVTQETIKATLDKSVTDENVNQINKWSSMYNQYRDQILAGDPQGKINMTRHWTRFMGCLAYVESLPTADNQSSYDNAIKEGPEGYRKPAGVEFYFDSRQSNPDSQVNLGLYQFSPVAGGNIHTCINSWNDKYPGCKISVDANKEISTKDMVWALGSAKQTFNAYCGVNKFVETFYIQTNTTRKIASHPNNFDVGKGQLKAPEDRCISMNMKVALAYNHFSPVQNGTGENLSKLMNCALDK